MNRINKKITVSFFVAALMIGFSFINTNKAYAAACISNGGSCWAVTDCNAYMSGGKDLIPVSAGDSACASVYSSPVKCCKIGGTSSSRPAAKADGSDSLAGGSTSFVNPLTFTSVEDFLTNGILVAMQRIIVTLSLIMIIFGAFQYITAGATSTAEAGKKTITAALTGLAIGIAAPSILQELSRILGWGTTPNATVNAAPSFTQIAMNVLNFMLGIAGIVALIMIVLGALMYLTSAGDDKRAESGKKMFQYSLIGIIIAMSAMIMVTQIARFFGTSQSTADTTPGSGIAPASGSVVSR